MDQGVVIGATYDLISFDPALAASILIGNFTFTKRGGFDGTYRSESANTSFLQFTVIPEPSTWTLIFVATVLLCARRSIPKTRAKTGR